MAARDPAEYKEASTKADASEAIDKIPAHVRQFVEEHWNGRLPSRDAFAAEVTTLACMAMVSLVREGKLAALLVALIGCFAYIIFRDGESVQAWATTTLIVGYLVGNGVGAKQGQTTVPPLSPKAAG